MTTLHQKACPKNDGKRSRRILHAARFIFMLVSVEPMWCYQHSYSIQIRSPTTPVRNTFMEINEIKSQMREEAIQLRFPFMPSIVIGNSNKVSLHQPKFSSIQSISMFMPPPSSTNFKCAIHNPEIGVALKLQNHRACLQIVQFRRNRGVLGFQIHPDEDDIETNTRLNMRLEHTPNTSKHNFQVSNIGGSVWSLPEPVSFAIPDAYSPLTGQTPSKIMGNHLVTAIPWIPSKLEIHALTVSQLKSELEARGLKKNGRKAELQKRIMEWTADQDRRRTDNLDGDKFPSLNLSRAYKKTDEPSLIKHGQPFPRLEANSLAEWARTVDLEPLLHRREEIHREKLQGKKKVSVTEEPKTVLPEDYLLVLQKVFEKPSSVSNRDVKQMYAAAKHADQVGDRELSKRILQELKRLTPNDARIYRRLSRLENEVGNISAARDILKEGLDLHPENAFLWHGLGQLEGSVGNDTAQKKYFRKAIDLDPSLPHSYHALGTLEHLQGRVANAMKTLKQGIEYCPTNHRLHHALGDLYRDANQLDMASLSYHKALNQCPDVSRGFVYTALAYTAYDQGEIDKCRRWLYKAVQQNNGRNANGWVALAQLEESEGNIEAARSACIAGIAQYERGLLQQGSRNRNIDYRSDDTSFLLDSELLKLQFFKYKIPNYRSGDRFFNVYRNWLRLEGRYGTVESVEEVYNRAAVAFPLEWKLAIDLVQYYKRLDISTRVRSIFAEACNRASCQSALPYRLYAEFEMSRGNFVEAQKILYMGATLVVARDPDNYQADLAELYLTWAVCEWHLGNFANSESLFEHSLQQSSVSSDHKESSKLRSLIYYVRARFEHYRHENRRAQHYIGLCLKENLMPCGNGLVWDLWAAIAHKMGDEALTQHCKEHGLEARALEIDSNDPSGGFAKALKEIKGSEMQHLMRRDPWHVKIFGNKGDDELFSIALLPEKPFERRNFAMGLELELEIDY